LGYGWFSASLQISSAWQILTQDRKQNSLTAQNHPRSLELRISRYLSLFGFFCRHFHWVSIFSVVPQQKYTYFHGLAVLSVPKVLVYSSIIRFLAPIHYILSNEARFEVFRVKSWPLEIIHWCSWVRAAQHTDLTCNSMSCAQDWALPMSIRASLFTYVEINTGQSRLADSWALQSRKRESLGCTAQQVQPRSLSWPLTSRYFSYNPGMYQMWRISTRESWPYVSTMERRW